MLSSLHKQIKSWNLALYVSLTPQQTILSSSDIKWYIGHTWKASILLKLSGAAQFVQI